MLLYEYEGKRIFSQAGIPVPNFVLIKSPGEVQGGGEKIGYPVVLKAQVLRGGRGKAGLIQIAGNLSEAQSKTESILQSEQGEGRIERILMEQKIEGIQEVYLGVTIDRLAKRPILVVCGEGGVDIEEISAKSPEKIFSLHVRPLQGLRLYEAVDLAKKIGIRGKMISTIGDILVRLYRVFEANDAELTEINPLIITSDNRVYALDSKMIINDDALYRHPDIGERYRSLKPLEKEAKSMGLTYVDLQPGNVAVISSGAGYTMMVLDLIRSLGGEPANFMDSIVDSRDRMQKAVEFTIKRAREDPQIRSILMLKTMSYTPLDQMMGAIKDAMKEQQSPVPMVSCLRATGNAIRNMTMEEAERQLKELGILQYSSLRDAVKAAVDFVKER
jgi:succinyl-CoA synthetase beta subunit